jgi:di/tricarboxylate transporter
MDALTSEMVLMLAVLTGAIVLFVTEVVRIDVAAVAILVVVGLLGLVAPQDLFAGFSSNAVISVIAVMMLGAGLDRVGVMQKVAVFLFRIGGRTEQRITGLISGTVAGISAFMQNIGAAALFLPVTERLASRTEIPISRLLMPMGFAAILGGTITLVASGPLILLNDLLAASSRQMGIEIEPFGLFAPTPIGLLLTVSGIMMFVLFGRWLLPSVSPDATGARPTIPQWSERYGLKRELHPVRVPRGSSLVGQTVEAIEATSGRSYVAALVDSGGLHVAPARDVVIAEGTVLGLGGRTEDRDAFIRAYALTPEEGDPFELLHDEEQAGLAEVVIRPGSDVVGKRVRDLEFRKVHGLTLLGIHRGADLLDGDLRTQKLMAGDVLLFFARWPRLTAFIQNPAFVALTDYPREQPRVEKQAWALGAFGLALALVLGTNLQLSLALLVGAVILLLSRVLTPDEAYRSVSWQTVFLLAALIPLGQAMEATGTAAWIAQQVIAVTDGLPLWAIQATIALLATAFTLTISNIGATVLLVPLAANVAVGVGASPAQFGMIVALAASNAFFLPTHQVNALLMGPGGYRVKDFLRAGFALSVLFLVMLVVGANLLL